MLDFTAKNGNPGPNDHDPVWLLEAGTVYATVFEEIERARGHFRGLPPNIEIRVRRREERDAATAYLLHPAPDVNIITFYHEPKRGIAIGDFQRTIQYRSPLLNEIEAMEPERAYFNSPIIGHPTIFLGVRALQQLVCHELAHLVVHRFMSDMKPKPHGYIWQRVFTDMAKTLKLTRPDIEADARRRLADPATPRVPYLREQTHV